MTALPRWAAASPGLQPAPFSVAGGVATGPVAVLLPLLRQAFRASGHPEVPGEAASPRLVLYPVGGERIQAYRRVSRRTFVVALAEHRDPRQTPLEAGYPYLVRALANLCLLVSGDSGDLRVHAVTPERGAYPVGQGLQGRQLAAAVYRHLVPLAQARLVIENQFCHNLPEDLWRGNAALEQLRRGSQWLTAQGLLVAPFDLTALLAPDDVEHVRRLFGLGALSYGNLSVREGDTGFWMTARGGDKRRLEAPGRDFALVTGVDLAQGAVLVRVPSDCLRPNRVSVDAVQHWLIYRQQPEVGAVLHVHAWLPEATVTATNYPCGTYELAMEVAAAVAAAPDPVRATVGLRNHGLVLTGPTMDDVLERVAGRLQRAVPPLP